MRYVDYSPLSLICSLDGRVATAKETHRLREHKNPGKQPSGVQTTKSSPRSKRNTIPKACFGSARASMQINSPFRMGRCAVLRRLPCPSLRRWLLSSTIRIWRLVGSRMRMEMDSRFCGLEGRLSRGRRRENMLMLVLRRRLLLWCPLLRL